MPKSLTEISFEGLNLNRAIARLSAKITLFDVKRQGKFCQITVKSGAVRQTVAFLQDKCYNIVNIRRLGTGGAFAFAKKHFLLPIFFVFMMASMAVLSNFCWKVEIDGDYLQAEVEQALYSCNVRVGAPLFGFDADKLENSLSVKLDAMYAVVQRKGSALYVNVVKRKEVNPPVNVHERRDIVATVSGRVKSILCQQGTVCVNVGDYVKKGTPLILGVRTFNDGTTQNAYAMGRVVLCPEKSAFVPFLGTKTELCETGNVFCTNAVVLFGKSYGETPPFEHFRVESAIVSLFPLNLTVERLTYHELRPQTVSVTLEQCLDELKQQALQKVLQQADFSVAYTSYQVTQQGVTATAFGEIEIN